MAITVKRPIRPPRISQSVVQRTSKNSNDTVPASDAIFVVRNSGKKTKNRKLKKFVLDSTCPSERRWPSPGGSLSAKSTRHDFGDQPFNGSDGEAVDKSNATSSNLAPIHESTNIAGKRRSSVLSAKQDGRLSLKCTPTAVNDVPKKKLRRDTSALIAAASQIACIEDGEEDNGKAKKESLDVKNRDRKSMGGREELTNNNDSGKSSILFRKSQVPVHTNDEDDEDGQDEGFHSANPVIIESSSSDSKPDGPRFDSFPFSSLADSTIVANKAFSWLVAPYSVQQFFESSWSQGVFVVHRKNPKYYGDLFSMERFGEHVATKSLFCGRNIKVTRYGGEKHTIINESPVSVPELREYISTGRSFQWIDPQAHDDRIWYLCEILQELFHSPVAANCHYSPTGSRSFAPPHFNAADAFILQIEGRNYWKVWAPENADVSLSIGSSDNVTDAQMEGRRSNWEGWLEQGDVLYVPRGWIHQTFADHTVPSLHVAVSTARRHTTVALVRNLMKRLLDEADSSIVEARATLPPGLLKMDGRLARNYAKNASFEHTCLKNRLFQLFSRLHSIGRRLAPDMIDRAAIDFQAQALPPRLTDEEKRLSVHGERLVASSDGRFSTSRAMHVRLLRRHILSVHERNDSTLGVTHHAANARNFQGIEQQTLEIPIEAGELLVALIDNYPEWVHIRPRQYSTEVLDTLRRLYNCGVLLIADAETTSLEK